MSHVVPRQLDTIDILKQLMINHEWVAIVRANCGYSKRFLAEIKHRNLDCYVLEITDTRGSLMIALNKLYKKNIYTVPRIIYRKELIGGWSDYDRRRRQHDC